MYQITRSSNSLQYNPSSVKYRKTLDSMRQYEYKKETANYLNCRKITIAKLL